MSFGCESLISDCTSCLASLNMLQWGERHNYKFFFLEVKRMDRFNEAKMCCEFKRISKNSNPHSVTSQLISTE